MAHIRLISFAVILTFAGTAPAFAYLDPGTASMLLQGLIGGAVAAASVVSIYWHRLKTFFVGEKPPSKNDNDET